MIFNKKKKYVPNPSDLTGRRIRVIDSPVVRAYYGSAYNFLYGNTFIIIRRNQVHSTVWVIPHPQHQLPIHLQRAHFEVLE